MTTVASAADALVSCIRGLGGQAEGRREVADFALTGDGHIGVKEPRIPRDEADLVARVASGHRGGSDVSKWDMTGWKSGGHAAVVAALTRPGSHPHMIKTRARERLCVVAGIASLRCGKVIGRHHRVSDRKRAPGGVTGAAILGRAFKNPLQVAGVTSSRMVIAVKHKAGLQVVKIDGACHLRLRRLTRRGQQYKQVHNPPS